MKASLLEIELKPSLRASLLDANEMLHEHKCIWVAHKKDISMGKLKFHATADFLSDATGTMHEKWATLQCILYTD